jgi:hypothetical protein
MESRLLCHPLLYHRQSPAKRSRSTADDQRPLEAINQINQQQIKSFDLICCDPVAGSLYS